MCASLACKVSCTITALSITETRVCKPAGRRETWPLAQRYASVVPAEGSVVDMLVRSRDKLTGQPLKPHQIVAQVLSSPYSCTVCCMMYCLVTWLLQLDDDIKRTECHSTELPRA